MMYFRYKLKDSNLNKDLNQRSLSSIILFKDRWKYSQRELTELEQFKHLIDFQGPFTREEFLENDQKVKREKIEQTVEIGKEKIRTQKLEKYKEIQKSLFEMDLEELKKYASQLGFSILEIKERDINQLRDLVQFELENRIDPLKE